MKPASYSQLSNHDERSMARMAARARCDTLFGGTLALVYSKRLKTMGSKLPYSEIVGDVYSASTGNHSPAWEAWTCPECDSVHLGQSAAFDCCAPIFQESEATL